MGDVILTTPLLRAIRRRHRDAHVAVVTKREYAPLLADNPNVDRVIEYTRDRPLGELAGELRAGRFTHHLDLHDSLRSRALRWLVPGRWTGYPKHRLARTVLIRAKRDIYPPGTAPVAERYFAAARELDVSPDGEPAEVYLGAGARRRADAWLSERGLGADRPLVVVAPMAAHFTKRWPVESWGTLVGWLTAEGIDVVVVGGPGDEAATATVAASGGARAASAAGAMDLQGTGALAARARVVAAGDTGVMHLGTAVGTPVVALFGPTVEALGFFPYRARATVLQLPLDCRPCSKMGGPACPLGHHRCLRNIEPRRVFKAVTRWL